MKLIRKYCLLTNDVETTSIWLNTLRKETGLKVLREGMPILLDIYAKYNIKSTFFFTGYIAKLFPEVVKIILSHGHEVGSHSMSHLKKDGLDIANYTKQIELLRESKKILEDISGQEVISFRAPALRVKKDTAQALIETGYKIDSSIASQRFDMFFSFGSIKKLKWLFSPRIPYLTSNDNLFKKGKGPLIEIPLSATLFPYLGTTMRIFPRITNLQRHILSFENSINGKPIVFDIHPNEFIDESEEQRIITKRSNNPIHYFFQDFLRSHLKTKNLGNKALPLYLSQIEFFKKRDFKFTTLKKYCTDQGFLNFDNHK